jgi:RNA polymerase sigma-70 factor (ECF subfamily)
MTTKVTDYSEAQINNWSKNQAIVAELYTKHYDKIFSYVKYIVKDEHDSEEVTNDVFDKVLRFYDNYDSNQSEIVTWLFNVTKNIVLDYFRTNHQDKYKAVSNFVDGEGKEMFQFNSPAQTDASILNAEKRNEILKAFRGLKPSYRKVAVMYFINEKNYNEISTMLEIPLGSVKGMTNRARKALQEQLSGTYNVQNVMSK